MTIGFELTLDESIWLSSDAKSLAVYGFWLFLLYGASESSNLPKMKSFVASCWNPRQKSSNYCSVIDVAFPIIEETAS